MLLFERHYSTSRTLLARHRDARGNTTTNNTNTNNNDDDDALSNDDARRRSAVAARVFERERERVL